MCTPQTVLDTIVGKIVETTIQPMVHHVGLLFHYKKNLNNLKAEMENLEEKRRDIKEKVDQANTRGEEVVGPVSRWLDKVEKEVEEFKKDDKIVKEKIQCFKFSCPNYISRYRMSKEAEIKISEVKYLTNRGSNFSTVAHPKPLPEELQFRASANYASFESRKFVFNNIIEALKDSNVKMIGVYGPGGVGKTTMMEEVGKLVKNGGLFDEVVVVVVSQDANVGQIQGQLADRLSLELKGETQVGKANKLCNRLSNGKKNLIILDDIWQELDLKTIGIPVTEGCKVVITSRIRDVLKNVQVDREFSIQVLSEEEAWDLFKKKVGNYVDSDQELHDIAVAVCKECQGLPVAIHAVGAALKDRRKYVWEDALDQLKDSMLKNIMGIDPKSYISLKLSYDWLDSNDAKSCFLLCCFFPEEAEISIEDLARHCIARRLLGQNPNTLRKARRQVLTVVGILKDACLLLEGTNENTVKMHDVIRDVALSIAKDDNKAIMINHGAQEWPEKHTCESYSTISLRFKNIHELPNDLVCPQLHTLKLLLGWPINPMFKVPDRFFSGMEKLAVLELNEIHMLRLPSSLANLVNLRMLCLNNCYLKDIAILKDLKNNLEILSLRNSNIRVLPSEIGQLTHLRLLDLENCKELTQIPQGVLSNLSHLEELYMLNGFKQWEAPTSNKERSNVKLDELTKLTQLTTLEIQIPNVMLLPKDLFFENLIRFKISMGGSFEIDENYSRIFKFKGISLRDELNVLLETAEMLDLENLEGLQEMHHDRGGGEDFLMQSYRLDTSRSFNKLTELRIRDFKLKYLFSPSCARGLPQLQQLKIEYCEIMEEIVGIEDKEELTSQVINFSRLKHMKLWGLPNLISFYPKMELKATTSDGNSSTQSLFNEKVAFPDLETLSILRLPNITEIWDKKLLPSDSFCQLTDVEVDNCEKLVNFVSSNMLSRLLNLRDLSVTDCLNMEVIALENGEPEEEDNDNIISFPQLRSLSLRNLQSLKSFCTSRFEAQCFFNNQVAFPALETLRILRLPNITEIWDKKLLPSYSFFHLTDVEVNNCKKLVNVVSSNMFSRLWNLRDLSVTDCLNMEVIALEKGEAAEEEDNDNIVSFPQVRSLSLENLQSLKSFCTPRFEVQCLFNNQVAFPALETLRVVRLPNITEIWDKKLRPSDSFCHLTDVEVDNCEKLVNVVSSSMLSQLWNLRDLFVTDCLNMEVTALEKGEPEEDNDNIISFPQLRSLSLANLQSLKSFCTSRFEAQCLFNNQVAFPSLEVLELSCLDNLEGLVFDPLSVQSFSKLIKVHVRHCGKLLNVIPSQLFAGLQNLEELTMEDCTSLEKVFKLEGMDYEEQDSKMLPSLKSLKLKNLPKLNHIPQSDSIGFMYIPQLSILHVHDLDSLRYLFSPVMIKSIPQLQELDIMRCKLMSRIVAEENGHGESSVDKIEFPQLKILRLYDMPNLVSFFPKVIDVVAASNDSRQSPMRPISKQKIEFPSLEVLELKHLDKLEGLGHDTIGIMYISRLSSLHVHDCDSLRYLFSPAMMKSILHLKELEIMRCKMMSIIFAEENEQGESSVLDVIEEQGESSELDIIEFPQLKFLHLYDLPHLVSFFPMHPLFKQKIAFPSLEVLELKHLYKLEGLAIGIMHIPRLTILHVHDCHRLRYLFLPATVKSTILQLQELEIMRCKIMTRIIADESVHGETLVEKIEFPQLKILLLYDLPNLVSFIPKVVYTVVASYESLQSPVQHFFNENVTFPRLEKLHVSDCGSFRNLFYPFMAKYLVHLQELIISKCSMVEEVVSNEEDKEKGEGMIDRILFPKLKYLELRELPVLKSFFHVNRVKIAFPSLEVLELKHLHKLEVLDIGIMYVPQLHVHDCDSLKYLFSPVMVKTIPQLQELEIMRCKIMTRIVAEENGHGETLVEKIELPQLKILLLYYLPNLVGFLPKVISIAVASNESLQSPVQPLFNENENVTFPNLEKLHVSYCGSFRNLFYPFMARYLVHLQELIISKCLMVEEVVSNGEDEEKGEGMMDRIWFPKLKYLELRDLPLLKSFFHVNHEWELPLLESITVFDCPQTETLSPGFLRSPNLQIVWVKLWAPDTGVEGFWTNDINDTLRQVYSKLQEQLQRREQQQQQQEQLQHEQREQLEPRQRKRQEQLQLDI